jgi:hypothetical protein
MYENEDLYQKQNNIVRKHKKNMIILSKKRSNNLKQFVPPNPDGGNASSAIVSSCVLKEDRIPFVMYISLARSSSLLSVGRNVVRIPFVCPLTDDGFPNDASTINSTVDDDVNFIFLFCFCFFFNICLMFRKCR